MEASKIPLDDPKTYRLLSSGNTLGVFQVESPGMQQLLKKVQPTSIHDVSAIVALYRPGPMGAGAHHEYAKRKASGQHRATIHPEIDDLLSEILAETYGLLVYQEQVMEIINRITGWSYAEADDILTAMRKKKHDKLEQSKPAFFLAASANGYSQRGMSALWETLVPFADYSFNKSHSVAYAHITVWTAYLKANYPTEYMASLLSHASEGKADERGPKELYLQECSRLGISLLPPDINSSDLTFTPTPEGIRYGIGAIKGVGDKAAAALISRRPYASLDDFFRRFNSSVLNSGVLEALIRCGAFDSIWTSREQLMAEARDIAQMAQESRRQRDIGQESLVKTNFSPAGKAQKDNRLRAEWELETIGVVLTHPVVILRPPGALDQDQWVWIHRVLANHPGDQEVRVQLGNSTIKLTTKVGFGRALADALRLVGMDVGEL